VAIAVGVAMAGLFLGTVWWDAYAFLTLVAVVVVLGLLELDVAFRARGLQPATPVAILAGLIMLYGAYVAGPTGQALGLAILLPATLGWLLRGADAASGRRVAELGATVLACLWVPFLASHVALLLARAPDGRWYVLATVALAVTNDIGAFGFGFFLGRHRMAPSISPAKTWEGFAGGLGAVLALAAGVTAALPGFDLFTALALGLVVSLAATLGDLAESLVKRDLGVKDLGRILPGHGGIMDRVDAMIFAVPAAHLLLLALGV
jgi:phosphatidate cytidylyltransferase